MRSKSKSLLSSLWIRNTFNHRNFARLSTEKPKNNIEKSFESGTCTKGLKMEEASYREQNFIDRLRLKLIAGSGGSGAISYYRDRVVVSGAPDGGDGGRGGHIFLKATSFFEDFSMIKRFEITGNNGKSGAKGNRDGKNGGDYYLSVPIGTIVHEVLNEGSIITESKKESNQKNKGHRRFLCDLNEDQKSFLIVRGGEGGHGNGKHRGVKDVQKGKHGEIKELFLELKTIADVGLVGYPNAGKSSLLAAITRALPKIANYPFTTLTPIVGKIRYLDDFSFTIADIPGIIEDAHKNKGLGLDFLRHIERTKLLVFVVDVSEYEIKRSPWEQVAVLREELLSYKKEFLNRPSMIVVNKSDVEPRAEEIFNELRLRLPNEESFLISAKHGYGIGEFVKRLRSQVEIIRQREMKSQKEREEKFDQREFQLKTYA